MKNEKWIKWILLGFLLLVLSFTTYYIWNYYNAKSDRLNNKNQGNISQINPNTGVGTNLPQDMEIAAKLRQEKEVQYAYVYVHQKIVFAPVVLHESVTKEDAQKLANTYVDILKTKYPDREASVQAVDIRGKVIAGATK